MACLLTWLEVEGRLYYGAGGKVISPLPVALVEGASTGAVVSPGTTDTQRDHSDENPLGRHRAGFHHFIGR